MNTTTNTTAIYTTHSKSRRMKSTARPVAITIATGSTISCAVANIANHPDSGVVVTIKGNPNGFIPNRLLAGKNPAAKEERRNFLLANPGTVLEVFVDTAAMAAPKARQNSEATTTTSDDSKNSGDSKNSDNLPAPAKLRPRIILNEDKIVVGKIIRARQEANANLRDQVASLEIGTVMLAQVTRFASKKNDNDDGRHFIGAFVELVIGLPAFLHKSQMLNVNDIDEGDHICVAIRSADMDGNRAKISVTQVSTETVVIDSGTELANLKPEEPAPRSASQAMWDQVAAMLNEPGSDTLIVIDPSV